MCIRDSSYVNDLRVDREHGKIYFTDSNDPGLIVLDMKSGENYRMLDQDVYKRQMISRRMMGEKYWEAVKRTTARASMK